MPAADVVQLIFIHFAAKRVAVDSKDLGCARLISLRFLQRAADEFLFEFRHRFFEQNTSFDHGADERFQFLFHCFCSAQLLSVRSRPFRANAREAPASSIVTLV
jgi:hypothetical protein